MSSSRRARERNAQSKGETYSRADEALWDDAYLLKLFNEQLGNSAAVSEVAREDEQHSASSSSVSTATRSEARDSASTTSSADRSSASSSSRSRGQHISNGAAGAAGSLTNLQLPDDIRALAQSFYNAGFEAGRFVGRAESSKKESRKRSR